MYKALIVAIIITVVMAGLIVTYAGLIVESAEIPTSDSTYRPPAAAEIPTSDSTYRPPAAADMIDRERLLAADVKWASCYLEYRGDPFMLEGCELGWYMHTEYFEHDYDIEPPWERD